MLRMRPRRNRRQGEFASCEFACTSSTWRSSSAAASVATGFYRVLQGSTRFCKVAGLDQIRSVEPAELRTNPLEPSRTRRNPVEHIRYNYDVQNIINLTSCTRPRHHRRMRFRVLAVVGVVGRIIGRPDTDPGM